jgi:SAM-dependent methyltransferase
MSVDTNFGSAEPAYSAFRPDYPEALFRLIMEAVPAPHERVLDLGAGTGLSALPLAGWFGQVVAVEPDPKMAARLYGLSPRVEVRQCSAEELEEAPGGFELITSGNAFYWMNGEVVISKIVNWLRPGGVLAVYRYGFPEAPPPVQEIVLAELKQHWDAFRHPRLIDEGYSWRVIGSCAGLTKARVLDVANVVPLSARRLVGFFSSTSYGSAYLRTLPSAESYLAGLEEAIRGVAGDSPIEVDFKLELILAHKP